MKKIIYLFLIVLVLFNACHQKEKKEIYHMSGIGDVPFPKEASQKAQSNFNLCLAEHWEYCEKLGMMYLYGTHGIKKDIEFGEKILKRACDAGDEKSCSTLKFEYAY